MKHNYVKHQDSAEDLQSFIAQFDCRIEDSRQYNQYVRPTPYHRDFWDGSEPFKVQTEVLPMKAIHLTTDNLARLVAQQEHMVHLSADAEYGKKCWVDQRKDQTVRDTTPAVAKAYQKYHMLLELARK